MPTVLAVAILGAGASAFAVALLSFAISYVIAQAFAPDAPEPAKDQGVQSRAPSDPQNKLPVAYGTSRLAGQTIFADISSDNQKMAFIIALTEGPVEGITQVWWQDKKLTYSTLDATPRNPTGAVDYDGKDHDFLNSNLKISVHPAGGRCASMEAFSSRWNSDAIHRSLPNVAYVYVELTYDREKRVTGLPSKMFFLVKGRTVGVLESNGTISNSSTASSNPVDCMIDYLMNTTYGAGLSLEDLDTDSLYSHKVFCNDLKDYTESYCSFPSGDTLNTVVINGADYDNEVRCTQQVTDQANFGTWNIAGTTSQAKRYTTNGILRTGEDIDRNISNLTIGNGAAFSYNLGKFGVVSEGVTSQIQRSGDNVSFSEDNIIGRLTISSSGFDEKLNEVTVKFNSISQRYQEEQSILEIPVGSPIRNTDEPRLERTLKFDLINNNVEAVRAGTIILNQSRQDLTVSFETDLGNSDLQAGDVVGVSHETSGWVNKLFKIYQVEERAIEVNGQQVLGISLTLREYLSTTYDDSVIQLTDLAPNTRHLDVYDIDPLNLVITDISDQNYFDSAGVRLTWDDSTYLSRVEYRYQAEDPANPGIYLDWVSGTSPGTAVDIGGLLSDTSYHFQVKAYNTSSVSGNFETTTWITPATGGYEVSLTSNTDGILFSGVSAADKTISVAISENGVAAVDYSIYEYSWTKETIVACVDNSGNFLEKVSLDVQGTQPACESVGGVWVAGQPVGFQCTTDGLITVFNDQSGQLLGCSNGYRADTENTGSSHNMRSMIVGADDIVNVGEFSCHVKRV